MDFSESHILQNVENLRIPAGNFSWSPSRQFVFSRCRRAYFFRFYLSESGREHYPPVLTREAYFCLHTYPFDDWLTTTICEAIRDAIAKITSCAAGKKHRGLGFYLSRQFTKATLDLQESLNNREYLLDAKRPVILEYLKGEQGFRTAKETVEHVFDNLSGICAALLKSGTLEEVSQMNMLDLRTDDIFLKIPYRSFFLWAIPGLIYFKDGMFCSLNCRTRLTGFVSASEFLHRISRINSIFRMYGMQNYPEYPILCTTLTFEPDLNGVSINCFDENIMDTIDKGSTEMQSYIDSDNMVRLNDFPGTCDPGICAACSFKPLCDMLSGPHKMERMES